MTEPGRIGADELAEFVAFLRTESGITLDPSKAYLVETRLASLMAREHLPRLADLTRRARHDAELRSELVDAMTTNETSFFRDPKTFDLIAHKLLPDHFERHGLEAPLRIWSAASSTGQEVYSIAMLLREMFGELRGRRIQLVATDISPTVLAQASKGLYTAHEVSRGLSPRRLAQHFVAEPGNRYRIHDELRGLVTFRQLNLLDPAAGGQLGPRFDLVLCRNVAIYFDEAGRTQLFSTLAQVLQSDGTLVLGSTETLRTEATAFGREEFRSVSYFRLRGATVQGAPRPVAPATRVVPAVGGPSHSSPAPWSLPRLAPEPRRPADGGRPESAVPPRPLAPAPGPFPVRPPAAAGPGPSAPPGRSAGPPPRPAPTIPGSRPARPPHATPPPRLAPATVGPRSAPPPRATPTTAGARSSLPPRATPTTAGPRPALPPRAEPSPRPTPTTAGPRPALPPRTEPSSRPTPTTAGPRPALPPRTEPSSRPALPPRTEPSLRPTPTTAGPRPAPPSPTPNTPGPRSAVPPRAEPSPRPTPTTAGPRPALPPRRTPNTAGPRPTLPPRTEPPPRPTPTTAGPRPALPPRAEPPPRPAPTTAGPRPRRRELAEVE